MSSSSITEGSHVEEDGIELEWRPTNGTQTAETLTTQPPTSANNRHSSRVRTEHILPLTRESNQRQRRARTRTVRAPLTNNDGPRERVRANRRRGNRVAIETAVSSENINAESSHDEELPSNQPTILEVAGRKIRFDHNLTETENQLIQIINGLRKKYALLKLVAGTCTLILVGVSGGLLLGLFAPWEEWFNTNDEPELTNQPTISPTADTSPTAVNRTVEIDREDDILSALSSLTSSDILLDHDTPQHMALKWLIHSDPKYLHADDPQLVQRFIAATIIFHTPSYGRMLYLKWFGALSECDWFGFGCNNESLIEEIQLSAEDFMGVLPREISELTFLKRLILDNNKINGEIPATLGGLRYLQTIDLHNNSITGAIPTSILKLSELEVLSLADCDLTGSLSNDSFQKLAKLQHLRLDGNAFVGQIPASIANCTLLRIAHFENNHFNGTMPDAVCSLALEQLVADCGSKSKKSEQKVHCDCCTSCVPN